MHEHTILEKCKLMQRKRKPISGYLGMGWDECGMSRARQEGEITWATRKLLGMMIMFNRLIVAQLYGHKYVSKLTKSEI